jgi:gamma-butyrobetaine dioxygenase
VRAETNYGRDEGGDTGLVDGFAAAAALRATDREAFDVLTGTTVRFEYRDALAELRTSQPLIELSPDGRIRGVRFNNRSARPPLRDAARFYAAYRRWAELLARAGTCKAVMRIWTGWPARWPC